VLFINRCFQTIVDGFIHLFTWYLLQFCLMPVIKLVTTINAPVERCFDLARSIDLHVISTAKTNERAIAGRMTGLAQQGDLITWQAIHFGINQKLTVRIEELTTNEYFMDVMVKGAFKSFSHKHFFEGNKGQTTMTDVFQFESPLGILGSVFNQLVLCKYMQNFLMKRNEVIKKYAESELWRKVLQIKKDER
jgi:ligand-binding SRPBCC domain-containing protein